MNLSSYEGKLYKYLYRKLSNIDELENQRAQFLHVESFKSNINIYLHMKVLKKQNGSQGNGSDFEFEDGIIDQLNFVPENYKKRIEELGLKDFFHEKFNKEENEKLEKHLRSEFNEVDNYVKELQNLESISNRSESFEKEKYEKMVEKGKLFPDWNGLLKIIYMEEVEKRERESFEELKCPVSSCFLTNQPNLKPFSHLVIFKKFNQIHKLKRNQISLFMSLESPIHSFTSTNFKYFKVNWTASYRWDSTIVTPYDKFLFDPSQAIDIQTIDYSQGKSRLIAWFVSNCFPVNDRKEIVKKLKSYVPVDVFGRCGFLECRKKSKCHNLLKRKYKFYLAFENSNCDHYITEKMFENAFKNNVVPVVYGARKSDYLKIAPPSSFIHYEDFNSTELLASYLLKLDKNSTLYNKYFEWKKKGRFMETDYLCRICSLLQDDEKPIMWYSDIGKWWFSQGSCSIGPWRNKRRKQ